MGKIVRESVVQNSSPSYTGPLLSENARAVLEKRYLIRNKAGEVAETPSELFQRVASAVASVESNQEEWTEKFYRLLTSLDFVPNSPCLMNAGRRLGQLFACFVLPVKDAIVSENDDGIFDTMRSTAVIHQSGGGTGFDFSQLRAEGTRIASTNGRSSGPLSFLRVYNATTETIHQGGFRRGANMGVLRVDHPDILDFIRLKEDLGEMNNFNLSVGLSGAFMESVRQDQPHEVINPANGERGPLREKIRDTEGTLSGFKTKEWSAREVFQLLVKKAHASGEPGILFLDRINDMNPTPALGRMEATNPCGEQPLLPFEACNLGSINLGHFVGPDKEMEWDRLRKTVNLSVRFLDNVIDVNRYPKPQIEEIVKGNRKIGLGVMGWADLLYSKGIPYDSEEAVSLGREVMKFIREEGWNASMELAGERGAFPNFDKSIFATEAEHPYFPQKWKEAREKTGAPVPVRNATVTTIAPTGTISIIAGASGGIEPLYSLVFERNVLNGEKLQEIHPQFLDVAKREGFHSDEIFRRVSREGTCRGINEIPQNWKEVFACAHDVLPENHMRMQAAFQEHCDNAVSKTVNFAENATVEDVARVYELAAELGVKGVTVYRNGSRKNQPMALSEGETEQPSCPIGGCD